MVVLVIVGLMAVLVGPVVAILLLLEGNNALYGLAIFFGAVALVVLGIRKAFSGPGKDILVPRGATLRGQSESSYQAHGNPQS